MGHLVNVDRNDPFQTVSRRRDEQELRFKVGILQQEFLQMLQVRYMVKIQTQQSRMIHELLIGPFGKDTREGDIIELGRFEVPGLCRFSNEAQKIRVVLVFRSDQVVNIQQTESSFRDRVRDRCLEETEMRYDLLFHGYSV